MKKCKKCDDWKEENMFNVRSESSRLRNECKACQSSYNTAYHIIHLKDALIYNKKYYSGHKKENLEYHRQYRKDNPGWQEAYNKKYYAEHTDRIKAYSKKYQQEHPEIRKIAMRNRRARKQGASETDLTIDDWNAILDVYDHRCAYCRHFDKPLTQDHVLALANGGTHSVDNIVPACINCNSSKQDKPVEEWLACQF
jgi:hypothetical protein